MTRPPRRISGWRLKVLLVVVASLVAACGDDEDTASPTPVEDDGGASAHGENSPVGVDARRVRVEARSFEFEPNMVTAVSGEEVEIALESQDGLHDLTIDEFDGHIAAGEDEVGSGGFRAGEPGRYTFYCSVEGHREAGMEGVLVVEER